jgi:hypothetical protein
MWPYDDIPFACDTRLNQAGTHGPASLLDRLRWSETPLQAVEIGERDIDLLHANACEKVDRTDGFLPPVEWFGGYQITPPPTQLSG